MDITYLNHFSQITNHFQRRLKGPAKQPQFEQSGFFPKHDIWFMKRQNVGLHFAMNMSLDGRGNSNHLSSLLSLEMLGK